MNRAVPILQRRSSNLSWSVIISLLLVYFIWGSTYLVIDIAIQGFPPLLMSAIRFIAGGLLFMIYLRFRGEAFPPRSQIGVGVMIGFIMLGIGGGGTAVAEQWVTSSFAAVMVAAVPMWAFIFLAFTGVRPGRIQVVGLIVGIIGIILLNVGQDFDANLPGIITIAIAPIFWTLGTLWKRRRHALVTPMSNAVEMFGGGFILLIISIIIQEPIPIPSEIPIESVLALLYLITFGAIIVFSAYSYLVTHVSPALATSYAYVNPVVAVLLGALAGEPLTRLMMFAIVLVVLGVALLVRTPTEHNLN